MTSALHDQVRAAVTETRRMIHTAIPETVDVEPIRGGTHPPAVRVLLDRLQRPDTPRCRHLRQRPVQPWMAMAWEGEWRCRDCAEQHGRRLTTRPITLAQQIEDGVCDLCRTHVGGDQLTALTIRDNLWVVIGGTCPPCTVKVQQQGGHLIDTGYPGGAR